MDVAQIISSAVMPGAAALPNSSEPSAGGMAPSSLFREMFVKAASAAELPESLSGGASGKQQSMSSQIPSPDRLLMGAKGAVVTAQRLAVAGGETPEQGDPEMTGSEEVKIGTLLSRAMALRQKTTESVRTPEHLGLTLRKGSENRGVAKDVISEGQQEAELLPDSEILPTADVSSGEKSAEGSETTVTNQETHRQNNADTSGIPALVALPAGLVSVNVSAPVVQNIPHGLSSGVNEVSTQPVLSEVALPAVQTDNESVRKTILPRQDDGSARMEQQPIVAEGKAELSLKNADFKSDATEKRVASLVQSEVAKLNAVAGKPEHSSSAGTMIAPVAPEASGDSKTAASAIPVSSPDSKEATAAVPGGEKMVGKDHGTVARHENASVVKQSPQEMKAEGKGETVQRVLPSGVTVLNPAQTVTMGRPVLTADAASLTVQSSDRGRISPSEGEALGEKGRVIAMAGESEKIALQKEGFSFQDNSNLSHDSETAGGNHGFSQATVSSGSFEAVSKGRLEPLPEMPRESEVTALHENILSQVREKLVNQDPSGTASRITLKLNPHELGELQITVRMEDHKMKVDITAQNPVVKEALLQNIDQLKDTLMRQNISMERFTVSTGDGGGQAFQQSFREGRQAAHQAPDTYSYPLPGYYQDDSQVSRVAFGDSQENSLVDMRF